MIKQANQNNSFIIESGLPTPSLYQIRTQWPFEQMAVGDSFALPIDTVITKARTAASIFGKRNNQRFTIRHIGNNEYRCWRVS